MTLTGNQRLGQFFLTAITAAVSSFVVGLVFFQRNVFSISSFGFQFIAFGIVGGAVFSSFRFLTRLHATIVMFLLLVFNEAVSHPANRTFLWQDILYYVSLCVALFVFADYFFDKLKGLRSARPLILGSLVAVGYIVVAFAFYVIFRANPSGPRFNLAQMVYYDLAQGFLIGIGLGAGIEIVESFKVRAK